MLDHEAAAGTLALNDMPINPTPEEVANGGRLTRSNAGGG
jgi:hypothetical protein